MSAGYVDTSCFTAIALRQGQWQMVEKAISRLDAAYSSNLLEAELRSVLKRENVPEDPALLIARIKWIWPDRPLTAEFDRILGAGYVRGADLWHLACALLIAPDPAEMTFLTLDERQAEIGRKLGFRIR